MVHRKNIRWTNIKHKYKYQHRIRINGRHKFLSFLPLFYSPTYEFELVSNSSLLVTIAREDGGRRAGIFCQQLWMKNWVEEKCVMIYIYVCVNTQIGINRSKKKRERRFDWLNFWNDDEEINLQERNGKNNFDVYKQKRWFNISSVFVYLVFNFFE